MAGGFCGVAGTHAASRGGGVTFLGPTLNLKHMSFLTHSSAHYMFIICKSMQIRCFITQKIYHNTSI